MKLKFRPLYDRILVERTEMEEKTAGGIFIPESAKEKPIQGTVIAVGKGKLQDDGSVRELEVQKGDTVLFGKYAGTDITIEGKEYLIMREDDVLGIVG
jgi:chaperonin GroES